MSTEAGIKADAEKPRYDLMPWQALDAVAAVLTFGARKYTDNGWRTVPGGRARYFAAGVRHCVAFARGQRMDPESGLPTLAHAICSFMFVFELDSSEAT